MLAGLSPVLDTETYIFASEHNPSAEAIAAATGWFRESEGISLILTRGAALELCFAERSPMRRITLQVQSSLDGVGLTAAVSGLLAAHGIACNMVAAFHHDHLFVPAGQAEDALALLQGLQQKAG
jgi:hypothetical protein